MNKKLVICLAAIPIALVVAVLLAVFFLNPYIKYHHAKKLSEDGNYDLAYSAFSELDGYGIGYITDIDLPKGSTTSLLLTPEIVTLSFASTISLWSTKSER